VERTRKSDRSGTCPDFDWCGARCRGSQPWHREASGLRPAAIGPPARSSLTERLPFEASRKARPGVLNAAMERREATRPRKRTHGRLCADRRFIPLRMRGGRKNQSSGANRAARTRFLFPPPGRGRVACRSEAKASRVGVLGVSDLRRRTSYDPLPSPPPSRGREKVSAMRTSCYLRLHLALAFCLSMIFSENRFPLFVIML
jgi:hypothetical protein